MTVLSFIILSISLAKGHPGNPNKIDIVKRHLKRQTSPAEVLHMSIFTNINALKPCRGQITISLHQCCLEGSSLAGSQSACRETCDPTWWQHDTTLLQFHQGSNVLANFTINLHQRHLIIDSSVVAMKRPWSMVQSSNRIDILGMYILPRTYVLLYFPLNQQILVHFSQTAYGKVTREFNTQVDLILFHQPTSKYRNLWSATLGKVLQFTAWNVAYLKRCETISRPVGLGCSGFASQKAQIKLVTTSPHKKVTENTHKLGSLPKK